MTSCCQQHPMPWNGATGAIARCKKVSTACGRKRSSVRVLHWICGVKRKPKAVNKPLHYFIVHGLDKPGSSATVSLCSLYNSLLADARTSIANVLGDAGRKEDRFLQDDGELVT